MFDRVLAPLGSTMRYLGLILALLLGLIAPAHAGGPASSVAADVAVPPLTVAASPIADAFLAAYRANGPPARCAALEGRSGSTWRLFLVVTYTSRQSAGAIFFKNGWVKTVTEATGIVTTNTYDPVGRRTAVSVGKPSGTQVASSSDYDPVGNLTFATDGRGNTTGFDYDVLNRQTTVTHPDSSNRTTRYETWTWVEGGRTRTGEQRATVDEEGKTTLHRSDDLGRLVQVVDALNNVTRYAYDEVGNQLTQTDALGRVTSYSYDSAGRRVRRTLPGGASEQLVYDRAGRLSERTDFKGQVTAFGYDIVGHLVERRPDPLSGEPVVSYGYLADGRRSWMHDGVGDTNYAYEAVTGRLTGITNPAGSLAYGYDTVGRLLSITSGRGTVANYTYDDVGRLATADGSVVTGSVNFGYDAASNLSSVALPNGVSTGYGYDNRNRLATVTSLRGGNTVGAYSYGYDNVGRRTSAIEHRGRGLGYTYDNIGRLTQEVITSTLGDAGTVGYGFDAVGNRLSRTSTVAGIPAVTSSYTVDDRLASDGYDANGNTVRSSQGNDAYTTDDRLKQRTRPDGSVVTIAYDGDGTKIAETVGGVTTWFLVDQQNPTGYTQTIEEVRSGAVVRSYLWGSSLAPLAQSGPEGVRFFGTDGHGSVRYLTDATGTVTDSFDYDAYGMLIGRTGTTECRFRYSGYEWMEGVGQYYLRARTYSPSTGRFWTADKFEGRLTQPLSSHKYAYGLADLIGGIDPTGRETLVSIMAANQIRMGLMGMQLTHGFAVIDMLTEGGDAAVRNLAIGTGVAVIGVVAVRYAAKLWSAFRAAKLAGTSVLTRIAKIGAEIHPDALVHFSPSRFEVLQSPIGDNYFFRYGDVSGHTLSEVRFRIGPNAVGSQGKGPMYMHVVDPGSVQAKVRPSAPNGFGFMEDINEYVVEGAVTPQNIFYLE